MVEVLGCIYGVGEISVMVTVESGPEIKLATSTDERTNTTNNGSGVVTNNTVVSDPVPAVVGTAKKGGIRLWTRRIPCNWETDLLG